MAINKCEFYTKKFEAIEAAYFKMLKTGKSYRIAGRMYEAHDIDKVEELLNKAMSDVDRHCNVTNPGIKTVRVMPSDC